MHPTRRNNAVAVLEFGTLRKLTNILDGCRPGLGKEKGRSAFGTTGARGLLVARTASEHKR